MTETIRSYCIGYVAGWHPGTVRARGIAAAIDAMREARGFGYTVTAIAPIETGEELLARLSY